MTLRLQGSWQRLQEVTASSQEIVWHITPCESTACCSISHAIYWTLWAILFCNHNHASTHRHLHRRSSSIRVCQLEYLRSQQYIRVHRHYVAAAWIFIGPHPLLCVRCVRQNEGYNIVTLVYLIQAEPST